MYTARLGPHGRVVIPAKCRKELALKSGDELIFTIKDNELHILSAKQALTKVQARIREHTKGKSLVDELIAMRREESAHE